MTGQEHRAEQSIETNTADGTDTEDLSQRIGEALQPTFQEASHRVVEVVAEALSEAQSSNSQGTTKEPQEGTHQPESSDETSLRRQSEGGMREKAGSSLISAFIGPLRDEAGDQLEHIADRIVDELFSRRAKGWVRTLADQTLQATLYDALCSIDEPNERYQLYRDTLSTLRPVVREAVDAMYNEDARNTIRRKLRGAIPSLLHGDFDTAFSMIADALSDVTNHAEQMLSNNSQELLQVFQQISTELLEESVEDSAEDKINPDEIQQQVQDKVEEAREKLADKVGGLQEGVQAAQTQLKKHTSGASGRGRQGAPSGIPPHGFPPSGRPPSGTPPFGTPPTGKPPSGRPPSGLPPAVEQRRGSRQSHSRHRVGRSRG